jgi:hypothetical protein
MAVAPRIAPGASAAFLRAALLITLAALALRLVGALYPSFSSHDLLINSRRLFNVQLGTLALFDRPSEFSRRLAIVSPTVFILAVPLTALGGRAAAAIQGLYSMADGLTPLLTAFLALRLGLSERAALVAGGLIAALPMLLTALFWGFPHQIVGQALCLALLMAVADDRLYRASGWLLTGVLAVVTLLIHNGVLLLVGVCLGLYVLLCFSLRRAESWRWRMWGAVLSAASLCCLLLQYIDAARLMLGGIFAAPETATELVESAPAAISEAARLSQIWVGLQASFAPMPVVLVVLGLTYLIWRTHGPRRLLSIAWVSSALIFFGVDLVVGIQVRYGYFIAPLACVGVAALTEGLQSRLSGRIVTLALMGLVVASGVSLWVAGAFFGVRPSVNPLTH